MKYLLLFLSLILPLGAQLDVPAERTPGKPQAGFLRLVNRDGVLWTRDPNGVEEIQSPTTDNVQAALAADPAGARAAIGISSYIEVELTSGSGAGAANSAAIQAALDDFQHVRLRSSGVAEVSATCVVRGGQTLEGSPELELKKTGTGALFINAAAYTYGDWDEDIVYRGLRIDANDTVGRGLPVTGTNGHIVVCRAGNVLIEDVRVRNAGGTLFAIHGTEWEDLTVRNCYGHGGKGTFQFQTGRRLRIENCHIQSSDDAIALNAYDYYTVQTRVGHIDDVVITGCNFEPEATDIEKNGYFVRHIPGAWDDWTNGRGYIIGSCCVSGGHIYRAALPDATPVVASVAPSHVGWTAEGNVVTGADGIPWLYMQPVTDDVSYEAHVRNIVFSDSVCTHNANTALLRCDDSPSPTIHPNYEAGSGYRGRVKNVVIDGVKLVAQDAETPVTSVLALGGVVTHLSFLNSYVEKPGYVLVLSSSVDDRSDTTAVIMGNNVYGANPTRLLDMQEDNHHLDLTITNTVRPAGEVVRAITAGATVRFVNVDEPFPSSDSDPAVRVIGDRLKTETGWVEWNGSAWLSQFDPLREATRYFDSEWKYVGHSSSTTPDITGGEMRADSGTTLSGYAKGFSNSGVMSFSAFSGAAFGVDTAGSVTVTAAIAANPSSTGRGRFILGVENGRTPSDADAAEIISTRAFGFEVRRDAVWEVRLFAHDGTTYTAGDWIEINPTVGTILKSFLLEWDGLGGISLYASASGGSRGVRAIGTTALDTMSGFGTSALAGRGAMWEVVNPASGTATNFQSHLRKPVWRIEPN